MNMVNTDGSHRQPSYHGSTVSVQDRQTDIGSPGQSNVEIINIPPVILSRRSFERRQADYCEDEDIPKSRGQRHIDLHHKGELCRTETKAEESESDAGSRAARKYFKEKYRRERQPPRNYMEGRVVFDHDTASHGILTPPTTPEEDDSDGFVDLGTHGREDHNQTKITSFFRLPTGELRPLSELKAWNRRMRNGNSDGRNYHQERRDDSPRSDYRMLEAPDQEGYQQEAVESIEPYDNSRGYDLNDQSFPREPFVHESYGSIHRDTHTYDQHPIPVHNDHYAGRRYSQDTNVTALPLYVPSKHDDQHFHQDQQYNEEYDRGRTRDRQHSQSSHFSDPWTGQPIPIPVHEQHRSPARSASPLTNPYSQNGRSYPPSRSPSPVLRELSSRRYGKGRDSKPPSWGNQDMAVSHYIHPSDRMDYSPPPRSRSRPFSPSRSDHGRHDDYHTSHHHHRAPLAFRDRSPSASVYTTYERKDRTPISVCHLRSDPNEHEGVRGFHTALTLETPLEDRSGRRVSRSSVEYLMRMLSRADGRMKPSSLAEFGLDMMSVEGLQGELVISNRSQPLSVG